VRRLQSFSGVLPLGTYLIYHLWKNWAIVRDREQWVDRVIWVSEHFGHTLEILFYIFLTVHVFLAILGKADSDHPLLVSRGQRRTQQVSGAASLLFILYHVYHVWPWRSGAGFSVRDPYATLWSSLPEPVCLAVYLFGMSVLYFHFANGLSRAVVSWGLISTERALRVARYAVSVVGIVLWGLTLQVVGHFVTGQGFFG
jgi:succinate dehydrogenase / fumarate reductase cytochrome b subunit